MRKVNRLFRFLPIYLTLGYIVLIYSLFYNYTAISYCYKGTDILFAFSLTAIIIFCFSFVLAIFTWGVESFLNLFFSYQKKKDISPLVTIIVTSLLFIAIGKYSLEFIKHLPFIGIAFEYYRCLSSFSQNCLKLLTLLAVLTVIIILSKQIFQKLEEFKAVFKYCAILLFLLSIVISITMFLLAAPIDYSRQLPNQYKGVTFDKLQRPNIILLTCESLSASKISLYGYDKNTTPYINELAKQSYVFDNMYAVSNNTAGSLVSIMEGVYPSVHKVFFTNFLKRTYYEQNLADLLLSRGYKTHAVNILNMINARQWGYENSFSYIEPPFGKFNILEEMGLRYNIPLYPWLIKIVKEDLLWPLKIIKFFCEKVDLCLNVRKVAFSEDILQKIEQVVMSSKEPYFILAHLPDLHPFYLPESYRKEFLKENIKNVYYNRFGRQVNPPEFYSPGEKAIINKIENKQNEFITCLDQRIGEFVQFLEKNNIFDNCILIITSDHGTSFRKGFLGHSADFLYEDLIHIPLILHMPNQVKGKRIISIANQIDITPTILELCNINKPEYMDGDSLVQFMQNPKLSTDKPKFSMALRLIKGQIEGGSVAVLKNKHKLIYNLDTNRSVLYDIGSDPGEKKDISRYKRDITKNFIKLILETIR